VHPFFLPKSVFPRACIAKAVCIGNPFNQPHSRLSARVSRIAFCQHTRRPQRRTHAPRRLQIFLFLSGPRKKSPIHPLIHDRNDKFEGRYFSAKRPASAKNVLCRLILTANVHCRPCKSQLFAHSPCGSFFAIYLIMRVNKSRPTQAFL
jgi:hypothetical protein